MGAEPCLTLGKSQAITELTWKDSQPFMRTTTPTANLYSAYIYLDRRRKLKQPKNRGRVHAYMVVTCVLWSIPFFILIFDSSGDHHFHFNAQQDVVFNST